MESAQARLDSLTTIEQSNDNCIRTFLELIAVPSVIYLYFLLGFLGIAPIKVHVHSIFLMGLIYIVALVFARHNATYARCYFKRSMHKFNANLKSYIVKNLMGIGKYKKSNATFDDFMKEQSANIRNDNYASVAASIFPTMGILGTFISIAVTMPDFGSKDPTALEREISMLLSGVGTAFYVSIYGIALSLWWIFYEKLGLSKFDKDTALIKDNTKVFFWTKEEIEQAYLQENLAHFKEISTMLSTVTNDKFFEKLGKGIEEKFVLFDKMLKLESEAVNLGSKQVKESIIELQDAQSRRQDLEKIHTNILKTLQNFSIGLDNMQIKSLENYYQINEAQSGISKSITKLNSDLNENVSKMSSLFTTLPAELNETQRTILNSFSETLDKSVNRFWDESLLASYERVEKMQNVNIDELKHDVSEINKEQQELMSSLEKMKKVDEKK